MLVAVGLPGVCTPQLQPRELCDAVAVAGTSAEMERGSLEHCPAERYQHLRPDGCSVPPKVTEWLFNCPSDGLEHHFTAFMQNKHAINVVILCGTVAFCVLCYKLQIFLLYIVAPKMTKQRWLIVNQGVTSARFKTAAEH